MWLIKQFKKDKTDKVEDESPCDTTEPSPVPPPANQQQVSGKSLIEACKILRIPDETVKNTFYYDYYRGIDTKLNQGHGRPLTGLKPSQSYQENRFKLQSFSIDAKINDTCSISVYRQKYTNTYTTSVEAVYELALPSYATVSAFQIEFDNKILKGIIKDKETAKAEYSDAIASGGQAFMAEKTDSGMFNLQLGNIPKEMEVTVEVTIISEIGTYLNDLHYFIHRSMFPQGTYDFRFTAEVYLSQPIVDIGLFRYEATSFLTDGPHYAKIEYIRDTTRNHPSDTMTNILVSVTPQPSDKPQSFIEYNREDNTYAVGINFYPQLDVEPEFINQKSEFIFVLDCSGSMSGSRINRAKDVLQLIMRSLNENIKFNIVLFGSSFNKVYPQSVMYTDSTLRSAVEKIERIDADLGGTELFRPMKDVLSQPLDPEYPRQVFVLTDGEIYDRPQLIEYVSKEAASSRIFTIGIGGQVDRELVIGLSKCCKGFYDFITETDTEYESKVIKLLDIACQPMISNIKVDWGKDITVAQAPQDIRPIYSKERMMIYGIISKGKSGQSTTIKISGDGPTGERLTFKVPVTLSQENDHSVNLHSMATYMRINDLELEENKQSKNHKELIIKLSKRFGLVSKHTSYIVTNESDKVVEDTMETVNINKESDTNSSSAPVGFVPPIGVPPQIGGPPQQQNFAPPPRALSPRSSLSQCAPNSKIQSAPRSRSLAPTMSKSLSSPCPPPPGMGAPPPPSMGAPPPPSFNSACAPPPPPPSMGAPPSSLFPSAPPPPPPPSMGAPYQYSYSSTPYGRLSMPSSPQKSGYTEVIREQSANGTFQKVPKEIEFDVSKKPSDSHVTDLIWNTLLVIAFLQTKYKDQESQWKLSIAKSVKYVIQQLKQSKSSLTYEQLLEVAKSSLKTVTN